MIGCVASEGYKVNSKSFDTTGAIEISLPKIHPKNLAIYSPNGQFFILHSKDDAVKIMPYQLFAGAEVIKIKISDTQGLTWIDGKKSLMNVFNEKGEYTIYLADDLETEPENTFFHSEKILLK